MFRSSGLSGRPLLPSKRSGGRGSVLERSAIVYLERMARTPIAPASTARASSSNGTWQISTPGFDDESLPLAAKAADLRIGTVMRALDECPQLVP